VQIVLNTKQTNKSIEATATGPQSKYIYIYIKILPIKITIIIESDHDCGWSFQDNFTST
jgi:hypothetical protein